MALELILATGNPHKADEFTGFFEKDVLLVKAASEKLDIDESGSSFQENALLKAEGYFQKYNSPVLADDSGLVVESLPNELGIYSARFGGEGLSDRDRALLLLEKLQDCENRKAHFVCQLCFYLSAQEIFFFEGKVEGIIDHEYKGDHGFGYDPVFIPNGYDKSLAELPEEKQKISHRSVASKLALEFFKRREESFR